MWAIIVLGGIFNIMDSDSIRTLLIFLCLLLLSACFSATEAAFSSFSRSQMTALAEEGKRRAKRVLRLVKKADKAEWTLLTANTLVNVAMAAVAATWSMTHFKTAGVWIALIIVTVLVLLFGEILPKSVAKEAPETAAMVTARFLQVFMLLFTPLTLVFSGWKWLMAKVFRTKENPSITEQELLTYVEEAAHGGSIDAEESELIRSAIEFNDLQAEDIFTPRVDVCGVENGSSADEIAALFDETGFSRLPVYEDSLDNIIGVIHQKDFYNLVYRQKLPLDTVIKPAAFVAPSIKISDLLRLLQKEKSHMAIITDEYGGTAGIITMEDILEELVGEIWDEHDEIIEDFQKIGDNEYRVVCSADFGKMFDFFHLTGETDSATVGGWVMEQLEKIPSEGDHFDYENLHVTVTKAEDRRVLEIVVSVTPEVVQEEE